MKILSCLLVLVLSSCTQKIYIVRHAEKAPVTKEMTRQEASDPPLSKEGEARALALKERLSSQHIQYVFTTNYKRTISTALPLGTSGTIRSNLYSPAGDSVAAFIQKIKSIRKGNILIVGHSNTVDDLANALVNEKVVPADLDDATYDQLFKITRRGNRYQFSKETYGK